MFQGWSTLQHVSELCSFSWPDNTLLAAQSAFYLFTCGQTPGLRPLLSYSEAGVHVGVQVSESRLSLLWVQQMQGKPPPGPPPLSYSLPPSLPTGNQPLHEIV